MTVDDMKKKSIIVFVSVDSNNYIIKKENGIYYFYLNDTLFYESDSFRESKKVLNEFLFKTYDFIKMANMKMTTVL